MAQTYPENPTPAGILANEASDDRAEDRSAVRSSGEECDGEATLFVIPDVGNCSAG